MAQVRTLGAEQRYTGPIAPRAPPPPAPRGSIVTRSLFGDRPFWDPGRAEARGLRTEDKSIATTKPPVDEVSPAGEGEAGVRYVTQEVTGVDKEGYSEDYLAGIPKLSGEFAEVQMGPVEPTVLGDIINNPGNYNLHYVDPNTRQVSQLVTPDGKGQYGVSLQGVPPENFVRTQADVDAGKLSLADYYTENVGNQRVDMDINAFLESKAGTPAYAKLSGDPIALVRAYLPTQTDGNTKVTWFNNYLKEYPGNPVDAWSRMEAYMDKKAYGIGSDSAHQWYSPEGKGLIYGTESANAARGMGRPTVLLSMGEVNRVAHYNPTSLERMRGLGYVTDQAGQKYLTKKGRDAGLYMQKGQIWGFADTDMQKMAMGSDYTGSGGLKLPPTEGYLVAKYLGYTDAWKYAYPNQLSPFEQGQFWMDIHTPTEDYPYGLAFKSDQFTPSPNWTFQAWQAPARFAAWAYATGNAETLAALGKAEVSRLEQEINRSLDPEERNYVATVYPFQNVYAHRKSMPLSEIWGATDGYALALGRAAQTGPMSQGLQAEINAQVKGHTFSGMRYGWVKNSDGSLSLRPTTEIGAEGNWSGYSYPSAYESWGGLKQYQVLPHAPFSALPGQEPYYHPSTPKTVIAQALSSPVIEASAWMNPATQMANLRRRSSALTGKVGGTPGSVVAKALSVPGSKLYA